MSDTDPLRRFGYDRTSTQRLEMSIGERRLTIMLNHVWSIEREQWEDLTTVFEGVAYLRSHLDAAVYLPDIGIDNFAEVSSLPSLVGRIGEYHGYIAVRGLKIGLEDDMDAWKRVASPGMGRLKMYALNGSDVSMEWLAERLTCTSTMSALQD